MVIPRMETLYLAFFVISIIVVLVVSDQDESNSKSTHEYDEYDSNYDDNGYNDHEEDNYDEGNKWTNYEKSGNNYGNMKNYHKDNYDDDYNDYDYSNNDKDNEYSEENRHMSALNNEKTDSVVCTMGVRFKRHPSDCGKFYQCANGRSFLVTCPAGLHFNTELEVCDWPSDADCDEDYEDDSDSGGHYEDQSEEEDESKEKDYNYYSDSDSSSSSDYQTSPDYYGKKTLYSNNNKGFTTYGRNHKFTSTYKGNNPTGYNKDKIFITDTGKTYFKGSTNHEKQTHFMPSQQHHNHQQPPQFVTHYHYSYQHPNHPQHNQIMAYPRKQYRKSWTRPASHHRSDLSALSKLIASLSSLSNKGSTKHTYPYYHHPSPDYSHYQPSSYYQPQQRHKPTAVQKKIIIQNDQPIKEHQPVIYEKILIDDRPVVKTPVSKIIKQPVVITNPQPQPRKQLVAHKIIVHGNGDKDQISSKDGHMYYYDTAIGDHDVIYYDNYPADGKGGTVYPVWEGSRTASGNNFLNRYVGNSIYSKEKLQGGALFNPQFFGKAFQDLTSERNLVHHYHHNHHDHHQQQPAEEVIKYVHHHDSHPEVVEKEVVLHPSTGGYEYIKSGGENSKDRGLLKTLLLMSPGGLQTVLMSKLLGSLQTDDKFNKKGSGSKGGSDLLDFLLLQLILNNNNTTTPPPPTTTPIPRPTPTVLVRNNQVVRADTLQPVTLVDPSTGVTVTPANAFILPNGQLVNIANGRPIGYVNTTGRFVPAIIAIQVVNGIPTGVNPLLPIPNATPDNGSATSSRQGINLIFLSPITPAALPPHLNNNPAYVQGTLRQLLGDDLARYLSNKQFPHTQGSGITGAAAGRGSCTVIRSDDFVPFDLPPQDGRRLSTSECNAMKQLLDNVVPTFLQNVMPNDLAAVGIGRNRMPAKLVQPRNNDSGQQLPALIPSNDASNRNNLIGSIFSTGRSNTNSGTSGSGNINAQQLTGAAWGSIGDYVTVQNDVSGCVITVPHIATRC